MADDASPFERLAAELDYPMIVITTADSDERSGCLAGFGSQCSIDPSRFAVWISKKNHTHAVAARADTLVIHVLRSHDIELASLFGEHSGDDIDKFARCEWTPGPGGAPILDGIDWFAGTITDRLDTGDHTLHVIDLLDDGSATHASEPQLGFQLVKDFEPGHNA